MKDIDCCKDCKKRGTDCHGDVLYLMNRQYGKKIRCSKKKLPS
jgi:hypothetical protein